MSQSPEFSTKTAEKFVVRLPQGMRYQIAEAARQYRRSMNSEIVARLEWTLRGDNAVQSRDPDPDPDPAPYDEPEISISSINEDENRLIYRFRLLPDAKRRAILDLLS